MDYPTFELNNGVEMPALGVGTYQIDDLDVCEESVSTALETGYWSIDPEPVYAFSDLNHHEIADQIAAFLAEKHLD